MDFTLPDHLTRLLADMDAFIESDIKPLENDNLQYFDHRRENARTDWDNDGTPRPEWEALLTEMRSRADRAGWLRYGLPSRFGGRDGSNLDMAVIREHLAHKGLGLHNDLQDESSIVGNFPQVIMMDRFGTEEQKRDWIEALITGRRSMAFGLTEPKHGSDATWMETTAVPDGDDWIINGQKIWTTGAHYSDHAILITRTDPTLPKHKGLTMFFLDMRSHGVEVRPIKQAGGHSGFNEVYFTNVRIPDTQRLGKVNDGWNVSLTTLMNERFSIGARLVTGVPEFFSLATQIRLADGSRAIDGKSVRSRLANWAARANGLKYTSYRAISSLSRGEMPGPENSIGKLVAASMMQDIAMYGAELQGPMGAVSRDDASPAGRLYQMLFSAVGLRIAGGTDEIMRNIIAERVLGLPGDVRVDKDVPFNKIPTSGRG